MGISPDVCKLSIPDQIDTLYIVSIGLHNEPVHFFLEIIAMADDLSFEMESYS